MPPSSPPSTTGARGSVTSGRGLAQGMVGSGLPTPVPALRPTPAPSQIPSPCALQRRDCAGNGVIVGGRVRAAAWAHELDLAHGRDADEAHEEEQARLEPGARKKEVRLEGKAL